MSAGSRALDAPRTEILNPDRLDLASAAYAWMRVESTTHILDRFKLDL